MSHIIQALKEVELAINLMPSKPTKSQVKELEKVISSILKSAK